jgi:type II secretory pathway component GspD/PulD (secretin)
MKMIKGKIPAITIVCLLLMISACQTTSNQSRGVESDKDLALPHSYQDDVSRKTTRKTNAYSSDTLKKRDIRRSGERMISKKQVEATPVTISDKMRKQLIRDAKRATKEGRYEDSLKISNAILRERPYDGAALALKENAKALQEDMRHKTIIAKIERVDARERNKYFENLKEKSIPYNDLMQFTTEDEWKDIKERAEKEDPEKRLEENRKHTERLKQSPSPVQKSISQKMQSKLKERLSIEFVNTPLRDVIAFLQEKSKMNFFLDKDAPDTSVNIKLNDVPLSVILEYILPKNLSYVVQDNVVHVTLEPLELRVYDVRDLLINLEDRAPDLTTQTGQATETEEQRTSATGDTFDRVKEIILLITSTIEPASWSANGGKGMIAAREGMLGDIVVTHKLGVHKGVEGLLAALRSSADLQIAIEARFIAVSDNFLEAYGHNIDSADFRGQDDAERGGIFSDGTNKFIDTGSTTGLGAATGTTSGLNLTYQIFGGSFIEGFLKAVQESDEAETVTAPKITLSNTQRGTIKVVTTVNYIESFTIVSQTPQPVIKQIDSGTTFSVRPIVSADRKYVSLEVHPVITTVTFDDDTNITFNTVGQTEGDATANVAANTIQRPSTVMQELSVTVSVPDKGILMIGGLGTSSETKTSKGVPFFSKIPIIKRLFSSDVLDRDITKAGNLIILIKPTILIREEEEARAFTKGKRNAEVKFPTYGP